MDSITKAISSKKLGNLRKSGTYLQIKKAILEAIIFHVLTLHIFCIAKANGILFRKQMCCK